MKSDSKMPLLSIIIPVYNTAPYLARCLDSVINQSIKNLEIIICNDLSTDNSEEIILNYSNQYSSIKYFKMQSKGFAGGARNIGLSNAKGKYVGFVDSDDWVDTMMYEKMINLMERSQVDIAICGVMKEYESLHDAVFRYEYKIENILEGRMALELLTRRYNQDMSISSIVCNKVYKLQFLKENKFSFLMDTYNEDDIFNFLCFLKVNKVAITPNTYYHYYQRRNSATHTFSKKHIDDLINGFCLIKKFLEEKNIYEEHKDNYHSFFEKCLAFVLGALIDSVPEYKQQNEYLKHLFSNSSKTLGLDYVDFIGAQRLRKFLTPTFTK